MVLYDTRPAHDAKGVTAPGPRLLVVTEEDAGRLSPLVRAIEAHGVRAEVVPPRPWLLDDGHALLLRATVAGDAMRPLDRFHDLRPLEIRGDAVLNRPASLQVAHHALLRANALAADGVRHVRTLGCFDAEGAVEMAFAVGFPVVLRPAYGRAGRGVAECADADELCEHVDALVRAAGGTPAGLAVQERIAAPADVHVLVAGGEVAGASLRLAAEGELSSAWVPMAIGEVIAHLAVAAVRAVGGDVMSVHVLVGADEGIAVLDVHGAPPMERFADDAWARVGELVAQRCRALA